MKKIFKLREIKGRINCTFSLSRGTKKPTKQQAKKYLLEKGWWLDHFYFRDVRDVINGANFSVQFCNRNYSRDKIEEIEIYTPMKDEYNYNCYTLTDIPLKDIILKNIKIENVEDHYEESLDNNEQYPYETYIDFECSIYIEFDDSQMDHQVVTREMCYE